MTDGAEVAAVEAPRGREQSARPRPGNPRPRKQESGNRPVVTINPEPDVAIEDLKKLIVDNYNAHRNPRRTPPLEPGLLHVIWFNKTGGNWKAVLVSDVLHGLRYELSHNGHESTTYIDVYKKVNNVQVQNA
jgi:Family of unknown function (DUF6275)